MTAETPDDELWAVLAEMGRLLNDVHVTLTDPETGREARSGGRSIGVGPFDNGEFSLDLVGASYAEGGLESAADGTFHYGWLADSVGYVHVGRFRDPGRERAGGGRGSWPRSRAPGASSSTCGTTGAGMTGRGGPSPAGSWPSPGST